MDGGGGFNLDVDPQNATNYEFGVRGQINSALRYGMATFYSDVQDQLIPFEVSGIPNRTFFRNAGSARHAGAEVEFALLVGRPMTVRAAAQEDGEDVVLCDGDSGGGSPGETRREKDRQDSGQRLHNLAKLRILKGFGN